MGAELAGCALGRVRPVGSLKFEGNPPTAGPGDETLEPGVLLLGVDCCREIENAFILAAISGFIVGMPPREAIDAPTGRAAAVDEDGGLEFMEGGGVSESFRGELGGDVAGGDGVSSGLDRSTSSGEIDMGEDAEERKNGAVHRW